MTRTEYLIEQFGTTDWPPHFPWSSPDAVSLRTLVTKLAQMPRTKLLEDKDFETCQDWVVEDFNIRYIASPYANLAKGVCAGCARENFRSDCSHSVDMDLSKLDASAVCTKCQNMHQA
jgi:hypothetical protein